MPSSSPTAAALAAVMLAASAVATPALANEPVRPQWRETARAVAERGVPLAELSPNAPDEYVVRRGDTLWAISGIFLRSPWRWPQLWGMNLDQIRNPHLIYPGQVLVLVRSGDRAWLSVGRGGELPTVKLEPQVRAAPLGTQAITSLPMHLIAPFLTQAVVLETNELDAAPRVVATQEGRVILSRGDTAYVDGELGAWRSFTLYRQPRALVDPAGGGTLGYEAVHVGAADLVRPGEREPRADGRKVPATFVVSAARLEAGVGDRLAPIPLRDLEAYVPHPPATPVDARVVSIYGDAVQAGQNQIVSINRGARDGIERGHVLALWRAGVSAVDRTRERPQPLQLPDEKTGLLFVFRVFERVSYGLVVSATEPVSRGDRVSQP